MSRKNTCRQQKKVDKLNEEKTVGGIITATEALTSSE
jgi:hypothetical protein